MTQQLTGEELTLMDRYWAAANYLTVAQIYLQENALLREPLTVEQIKPRLLGHWGTSPGLSLIYVHLNRLIRQTGANVLYVAGPGHGGPAMVANVYLEGTYSQIYPEVGQDLPGLRRLIRQFSTPGGIPSHVGPPTPGSIHEGGELGYSLAHATGAVLDNPELIAACVIGDGEAETGPLAASWKAPAFLNPARDGAVLPILHLNGNKISGPTVLGRQSDAQVASLLSARGWDPVVVAGDQPEPVHLALARALDDAYAQIRRIQQQARGAGCGCSGPLARDHPAHAQGLDRSQRGGRRPGGGYLPVASGAAGRRAGESGPSGPAGGLDAFLPAGGTVRRNRAAAPPTSGAGAGG